MNQPEPTPTPIGGWTLRETHWVNCPICDESDMEQELWGDELHPLIFCVNHACPSNVHSEKAECLTNQLAKLSRSLALAEQRLAKSEGERDAQKRINENTYESFRLEVEWLQSQLTAAVKARNHNRVCIQRLTAERDALAAKVDALEIERDEARVATDFANLATTRMEAQRDAVRLAAEQAAARETALRPFVLLGRGVCKWLRDSEGDIFEQEDSEDLMEIMHTAGLALREPYDPEKHGDVGYADPGDEIWSFLPALAALDASAAQGDNAA